MSFGDFLKNCAIQAIDSAPDAARRALTALHQQNDVMAVFEMLDSQMGSKIESYVCEVLNGVLNSVQGGARVVVVHTPKLYPAAADLLDEHGNPANAVCDAYAFINHPRDALPDSDGDWAARLIQGSECFHGIAIKMPGLTEEPVERHMEKRCRGSKINLARHHLTVIIFMSEFSTARSPSQPPPGAPPLLIAVL